MIRYGTPTNKANAGNAKLAINTIMTTVDRDSAGLEPQPTPNDLKHPAMSVRFWNRTEDNLPNKVAVVAVELVFLQTQSHVESDGVLMERRAEIS